MGRLGEDIPKEMKTTLSQYQLKSNLLRCAAPDDGENPRVLGEVLGSQTAEM